MKKTCVLRQGSSLLADTGSALILMTGVVMLLAGCETVPERTSLAMPPPAFDPAQTSDQTSLADTDFSVIEPAAGNAMRVTAAAASPVYHAPSSPVTCNQASTSGALGYQWNGNSLDVAFNSSARDPDERDNGTALLRYSISLQKPRPQRACDQNALLNNLRDSFDGISQ